MRRASTPIILCALLSAFVLTTTALTASSKRSESQRGRPLGSVCLYSHSGPHDPIVHPGMHGMAHSHDFFGNTSTGADSTPHSLRAADTTCKISADRAAYWFPSLYADGVQVLPSRVHAYYGKLVKDSVVAPPRDLRIIAGGTKDTVRYTCMRGRMPTALKVKAMECRTGAFTIGIKFPDCWNGTDLDSTDHRSHMAYSSSGRCPDTHPVAVARLFLFSVYPGIPPGASLSLSSGELGTAHADFFNTWDEKPFATLIEECVDRPRNCQKQIPKKLAKRLAL